MSKPIAEQISDLIAKYRNIKDNDEKGREDLAKLIADSTIPSYHKEVLVTILLAKSEAEMVCALEVSRQREKMRHADAMMQIECRALEERMRKRQRA